MREICLKNMERSHTFTDGIFLGQKYGEVAYSSQQHYSFIGCIRQRKETVRDLASLSPPIFTAAYRLKVATTFGAYHLTSRAFSTAVSYCVILRVDIYHLCRHGDPYQEQAPPMPTQLRSEHKRLYAKRRPFTRPRIEYDGSAGKVPGANMSIFAGGFPLLKRDKKTEE